VTIPFGLEPPTFSIGSPHSTELTAWLSSFHASVEVKKLRGQEEANLVQNSEMVSIWNERPRVKDISWDNLLRNRP